VVPGFPDYDVSNLGRVRSRRRKHPKILKPDVMKRNYLRVTMAAPDGSLHRRMVHRLVLEAFKGPPPPDKPLALHGKQGTLVNTPENLRWGTQVENGYDRVRDGVSAARGERNAGGGKLTEDDIRAIRACPDEVCTVLARRFNISKTTLYITSATEEFGDGSPSYRLRSN
jgi:hypothetical protein